MTVEGWRVRGGLHSLLGLTTHSIGDTEVAALTAAWIARPHKEKEG